MTRNKIATISFALTLGAALSVACVHPFGDAERVQASSGSGPVSGQSDSPAGAGDATHGQALFEKRCTGCHSLTANHQGPKLQGVFGRAAGSIADYEYSPSLKKANITWGEATLDKWLTDTDALVPGNNMDFSVSKPEERRDLIAFLRKSSGK